MINFNKQKAAEFVKKEIRRKRKKQFPDLDVQYMRALEINDTDAISDIVSKKQSLRNATNIDTGSFQTRDELVQLWPTDLLGSNPFVSNGDVSVGQSGSLS